MRHVSTGRGRLGSLASRLAVAVVLMMLVAAGVAYRYDLGDRLDGRQGAPVEAGAPASLGLPAPAAPRRVAAPLSGGAVDRGAVRRAVAGLAASRRLGPRVGLVVADAAGREVYRSGPRTVTPASTAKLLTVTAALQVLGPQRRFSTTVVGKGRALTLVGGGDPLLASRPAAASAYPKVADVRTLARRTASALRAAGRRSVRLTYDESLFTGPDASPAWEPDYIAEDVVSPITALWVDEGREKPGGEARSPDPGGAAAAAFASALRRQGIRVIGRPAAGTPAAGAEQLAVVRSPALVQIVQHVLEASDNEGAEVLARQVAIARGEPASFTGAARAVTEVVSGLGVGTRGTVLYDASGLARGDRLPVETLVEVVAAAAQRARSAAAVAALPVAGFTGSLSARFESAGAAPGRGEVRAKTGTLSGVHALAGVVTSRDGAVMTFAVVADRVPVPKTLAARHQLDRIAAALAACTCA